MKDRAWDAQKVISSLDFYGKVVPTFNLNGESKVKTTVGGFMTLVIMIITFSYTISNFIDLTQKKDP